MTRSFSISPLSEVRHATAQLIASQVSIPASPGRIVGGKALLCLAACAAEAGLLARGETEAAAVFREKAARSTDKAVLYDAFDRLGWPRESCDAALQFNDSQSPQVRKQRILDTLAAG